MPLVHQIEFSDPMTSAQTKLKMKEFVKTYLREMIDSNLSLKNHIDLICPWISKSIEIIIAKLRHLYIPCRLMLTLTLYLNYGIMYMGLLLTNTKAIGSLPKMCNWAQFSLKKRKHSLPLFIKIHLPSNGFLIFLTFVLFDVFYSYLLNQCFLKPVQYITIIPDHLRMSASVKNFNEQRS